MYTYLLTAIFVVAAAGKMFTKLAKNHTIEYPQPFFADSQVHCAFLCNCNYFYFENKNCYANNDTDVNGNHESSVSIHGLHYVNEKKLQAAKDLWSNDPGIYVMDKLQQFLWVDSSQNAWDLAKAKCYENWNLLQMKTGNDKTEFIKSLNLGENYYWISGSDLEAEADWRWIDGTSISISDTRWAQVQPDNNNNNQNCLVISSQTYLWDDRSCFELHGAMCEMSLLDVIKSNDQVAYKLQDVHW